MKTTTNTIEGINIEVENAKEGDKDGERRKMAYMFKYIREQSGMNRVDFAKWLGIPYRTMPEYLLSLIAYKVFFEKAAGRIGKKDD